MSVSMTGRSIDLEIPRYFRARSYQKEFVRAMRGGCRRAVLVWHRRAGKDACVLNWTIEAMVQRPGSYYYFFPTLKQGRRILWKGIQADGKPFLSHFPEELIIGEPNETEMSIKLAVPGGGYSMFQLLGANEIDKSAIGTNPVGVVFSEYSLQNPSAWDMIRPILAENLGWSVFAYTPRGQNWGWSLWKGARENPVEWFASMRTVDQTLRDGENEGLRAGQPVVSHETIESERRTGMAEELIQQEFYCSFEGAILGSYYGDALDRMQKEGRIRELPYNRDVLVDTAWDLGVDDETVIGFTQTVEDRRTGQEFLHLIDVHADRNQGLDAYWRVLKNEKPYIYGQHLAPWDIVVKEWGSGNTRLQTAQAMGLNFEVGMKLGVADGINAVRRLFPILYADERRCAPWVEMMRAYHREFDEERMTFLDKPVHDASSHWADMTRVRAVAMHHPVPRAGGTRERVQERAETDWDVFAESTETQEPFAMWERGGPNWSALDSRRGMAWPSHSTRQ